MGTNSHTVLSENRIIEKLLDSGSTIMIYIGFTMGVGTISSLIVAGSSLGYSILWVIFLTGWLAAAAAYAGGKVCTLTQESPAEVVTRYTHPIFSIPFYGLLVYIWYYILMLQGNVMAEATSVLLDISIGGVSGTIIQIAVLAQLLIIAFIFVSGYDTATAIMAVLVAGLVLVFLLNTFIVGVDISAAAGGMIPTTITGSVGRIGFAGIVGAAIGVGPILYAYFPNDIDLKKENLELMAVDQVLYMGILFTFFSAAIYVSAASTLQGVDVGGAVDAATSIEPVAGQLATTVFTVGLWAASFTTLGGFALLGAYFLGDLINISPLDYGVSLSLDDIFVKTVTVIGLILASVGPLLDTLPPLPFIAFGLQFGNIIGAVTITIFTIAVLRSEDVGDLTGPWYLVVGLIAALSVSIYAVSLTGTPFIQITLVAVGLIMLYYIVVYTIRNRGVPKPTA